MATLSIRPSEWSAEVIVKSVSDYDSITPKAKEVGPGPTRHSRKRDWHALPGAQFVSHARGPGSEEGPSQEDLGADQNDDCLYESVDNAGRAFAGDMAAVPTSDTLARDLAQLAGIMKTSTTDGSVVSKVSASEDVEPLPCEPWSGRYREAPEAFASLLEVPSAKEAREPTLKHKVIVLPPSRRNALRSPSPENNSPLVRLTRLRSPEISPRLLRPMPLFAQTAALCVTKPRALHILERGLDWEATREVTDLEAALPETPICHTSLCPILQPGLKKSRGARAQSPDEAAEPMAVLRRVEFTTDEAGRTDLMHAARDGDLVRASTLLCAGLPVDATDSCKCTALMYATTYGHVALARLLIEQGANVNALSHDRWTPLIAAVYNGHLPVAKYLLSKGANIECADDRGWTALMHVGFNGKVDILQCLLEHHADTERKDNEGRTALVYAAFSGHLQSVKLLLAATKRSDGADGPCSLALMFAADKGHMDVARTILDTTFVSVRARASALELANLHGHHEVALHSVDFQNWNWMQNHDDNLWVSSARHQVSQIQNISCLCAHSSRVCYFAEAPMPPVPNNSEDTLLQAYTALKNAVALDSSLQKEAGSGNTRCVCICVHYLLCRLVSHIYIYTYIHTYVCMIGMCIYTFTIRMHICVYPPT
ncbi:ANKRD50 [Symbiodinium necroappetens]|uniref:ANKRD50 protein n=1 Tax=Symbiodinium necroappetens TaxID=1628268 RepID=A0A813BKI7_9DINO|nr:ANKRD50 [Symbiodinium necroappetens]